MGWNRFAVGLAYRHFKAPVCDDQARPRCATLIGYGVEPLRGWIGDRHFKAPKLTGCGGRPTLGYGVEPLRGWIGVPDFKASLFGPLLYPLVSSGKSGPEFRDFAPRESSKTIDSPRPISENEGHDRHFACPSLVHARAPCRRRPGRRDESQHQPAAAADSRAAAAGIAEETRTLRVGLIAGPEATWDLAAARLAEHLRRDQDLEVYHAWDCVELGIDDPTDYDCLVLLGWPAASSRERIKRIELYCRGGGSLVALRAMHAEIPGWSNFTEEVLGGRQPLGRKCRLLEVERSQSAWHHPVVRGVETMIAEGDVYSGPRFSPDATVLLTAQSGQRRATGGLGHSTRRRPRFLHDAWPGRRLLRAEFPAPDFQRGPLDWAGPRRVRLRRYFAAAVTSSITSGSRMGMVLTVFAVRSILSKSTTRMRRLWKVWKRQINHPRELFLFWVGRSFEKKCCPSPFFPANVIY